LEDFSAFLGSATVTAHNSLPQEPLDPRILRPSLILESWHLCSSIEVESCTYAHLGQMLC